MKPALVLKAMAIFAVTSLVRCAPVESQSNEIAEGNTEFCTHFYEHVHFQGLNTVLCDKQKQCLPAPSFGVSSINPNPKSCGQCRFYKQPGCAGDFIEIRTIETIEDLSDSTGSFLNWNDAIKSFSCDVKFCGATSNSFTDAGSLNSDHQAKDIEVRSSTKLAERDVSDSSARVPTQDQVQTPTNRINVSLYTDTQFNGPWIDLSAKVNVCAKITKFDGTGHNFELSSARITTHNTTSDGQVNLAYRKFYKGKDCEENTWVFTIGNNQDATDLNDISQLKLKGLENNVNDKIWSTYCIWDAEIHRRDLPHTTTDFSQVPAPKTEVQGPHPTKWVPGIPYGMLIYPKPDYQGDPMRAWIEPGQCYYIDYSGPNVGLLHPLWSYGSIKMDLLPQWILDMAMDIRYTFTRASWCEYPLFNRDSTHDGDLSHVSGTVNGYWCEWYKTTLSRGAGP